MSPDAAQPLTRLRLGTRRSPAEVSSNTPMSLPIEDYALIGNMHTAALVGRDGSIDWLCVPRFDSPACFAALLGTPDNGRWLIGPVGPAQSSRRYLTDSM